ncbi:MAG TPA: histidine kinase [Flavisolibacter sp.]|jgi:signal transduction histidine kinase|nr:histidine kinase [Flavisolibacter sp.]
MILLYVSALPVYLICCMLMVLLLYAHARLILLFYSKRTALKELERLQLEEDHRQQLLYAIIHSQESERNRMAADLHDGIGPLLSVVMFQLGTLQEKVPKVLAPDVGETRQLMEEVLVEVHRIINDMTPFNLKLHGLKATLKEMLKRMENTRRIITRIQFEQNRTGLTPEQELMAYRVTSEVIHNTIRHGKASHLQLIQQPSVNAFILQILHNGAGLKQEEFEQLSRRSSGMGLKNITGRLQMGKGTICFEKMATGYSITLSIPFQEKPPLKVVPD